MEASYVIGAEMKCSWGGDRCPPKVFQKLMKHWAMEYNYSDISDLSAKLLSWLDAEQAIVPEIGIKLTQKCTLSCKHCMDRIPFLPQEDVPLDVVLHDLELLLKHALYIGELTFVTGEVLIYPYLPEVLELAVRSPKVHRIMINTNGTVIPNEKAMPFLQSPKCIINISDYGNLVKMAKAVDFYERTGINFTVRTEMKWKPYGAYPVRQGLNIESLREIFATCSVANGCPPMMSDGKFYICGIAEKFHALGECCSPRDYVDLSGKGTFKENYNRMMNEDYLECCDMCDIAAYGNSTEFVVAGMQNDPGRQWHRSAYTIAKRVQ